MPHQRPVLTLILFYLLALAISWVFWAPLALAKLGYLPEAPSFLHLLGSLGPALAALMVSRLPFSPVTTRMLAARLSIGSVLMTALMAAILLPLAIGVVGLLGQWLAMGTRPPLEQALQSHEYPYLSPAAWVAASVVFYGFGEEIGWRGLAIPILNRRFNALACSLLMTLPWAVWHLPLLVSTPTYTALGLSGLAGWVVSLATGSVLLTLFLVLSRGSLIPVAIFHAAIDLAMVNPAVTPLGINIMGGIITIAGLAAAYRCYRIGPNAPDIATPPSPLFRPSSLE
ncbi:type II CAAX endopeptidase family protein [Rhizobium sp. RU36D]|uniref:CPBP family intramembrane glutamic endopeptidase n=1 Tax=Rhizobium sp. RU36D TaxID=1907415 RepID=UPI0009D8A720|nr:type II CAAX endopeptidase family protein [Rhizobium sp. RU36D]SMC84562.1 CAAX protease self-immunity [Rhizobium sp. RU36D]